MDDTTSEFVEVSKNYVPICAIGASAGGVGALRSLFRQLPDDLGLAYVVILHLSPEHPSAMAEILASCTDMPVHQVDDTPTLNRNCVYVIPPDRELVIKGDSVTARPFSAPRGQRAPIDMFFRSVAAARGDGMAVVLSGAGSDGSTGVRAVKEAGGVIFAQDPADAEFPSMPQNAIATGVVSFVAPVAGLGERIAEVARSKEAVRSLDDDGAANDLRNIVGFLRTRTGHDFANYKRATVMRRVLRRMHVRRVGSFEQYSALLQSEPEEAHELFDDLLISVTHFFRDEEAFKALAERVIGPLFDDVGEDGIRVWSAGCATGEEAYSVAILLLEEAERRELQVPIQIFASDLDEGALATAREGRYPRSIEADVPDRLLKKYFVDDGTHYRIRQQLREVVLFATHSVLKDPPFLRLDLIMCRNLLIYVERALQEQLLNLFHYGLKPNGSLFLGTAETADTCSDLFVPLDREARIYRARPRVHRKIPTMPNLSGELAIATTGRPAAPRAEDRKTTAAVHLSALEQAAPPSVLVNELQQIVHLSPKAGRFILPTAGAFSARLADLVRTELRLDLKIALDEALEKERPSLCVPVTVQFEDGFRRIAIQVAPVRDEDIAGRQALVVFLDAGPSVEEESEPESDTGNVDDVRRLKGELKAAQEALVASRGEHETAMEDLRAANEELQSINEEYRSTSEELETSKEELQSMNEELQTVNAELKSKLESTSTAHSDLRNLIAATEIGTLFLDTRLRIRMFTPPMAGLFNITEMDVGRAITDFTSRLIYETVEEDARQVLTDLSPVETEVQSRDGRWFIIRLRPYRTVEDKIEGVVLTFVDISGRRATERELIESRQRYQVLFDSIDEGFAVIDMIFEGDKAVDYRFVQVNAAFSRQTGLPDPVGKTMLELIPEHEDYWFEHYGRIAKGGSPQRFEARAEGLRRYYDVFAFPVDEPEANRVGVLFRDVSERHEAQLQREMLTDELSHRVKNTLAVVQALARQPGSQKLTVEQYRDRLVGRVQALARAHDQLLKTHWQTADLETLIDGTLKAYVETGQERLLMKGPDVSLTPKQVLGLALIFHELATNASKYGSLSVEEGTLSVTWKLQRTKRGARVKLVWQEHDGPPVKAKNDEGFGTRLIKQAVSYELEGSAELHPTPDGFIAEIEFPSE